MLLTFLFVLNIFLLSLILKGYVTKIEQLPGLIFFGVFKEKEIKF
jgi:hypothetical protein